METDFGIDDSALVRRFYESEFCKDSVAPAVFRQDAHQIAAEIFERSGRLYKIKAYRKGQGIFIPARYFCASPIRFQMRACSFSAEKQAIYSQRAAAVLALGRQALAYPSRQGQALKNIEG